MGQSRPVLSTGEVSDTANQNTVVIRMTKGVFYGLFGTVFGVAALVAVFLVGLRLGGRTNAGPAVVQSAYSPGQSYVVQPGQPPQAVPAQPFDELRAPPQVAAPGQSVAGPSKPPAGNEIPIGDNPRLALPELAQASYVLDFGEVTLEQGQVTKEVLVRNTGVKDLFIADVQTTCSCTQATVDQRTVPPGSETVLRVIHDPQVMVDHGSTSIAHQVLISSNDPAAPWVEFNMSGTVVQ